MGTVSGVYDHAADDQWKAEHDPDRQAKETFEAYGKTWRLATEEDRKREKPENLCRHIGTSQWFEGYGPTWMPHVEYAVPADWPEGEFECICDPRNPENVWCGCPVHDPDVWKVAPDPEWEECSIESADMVELNGNRTEEYADAISGWRLHGLICSPQWLLHMGAKFYRRKQVETAVDRLRAFVDSYRGFRDDEVSMYGPSPQPELRVTWGDLREILRMVEGRE